MIDYYNILGVSKTATDEEIKLAYRALAKKYHPDINKSNNAETKFKEINDAYDVLKDKNKRSEYDNYNSTTYNHSSFGNDFSDIFDMMREFRQPQARNVELTYTITLEDVLFGKETDITYTVFGYGKRTSKIKIPKGIDTGMTIKFAGAAGTSPSTKRPIDLFIKINVEKHSVFQREGSDLLIIKPIDAIDAMLGLETLIVSLDGSNFKVKIPAGIQHHQRIRIPNKGLPKFQRENEYGHLFIIPEIIIPTNLTDEQKSLLRQFNTDHINLTV